MRGFRLVTAGVALAVTATSAAPALADGPGRWRHYRHHDRGLDAGALIGGLALVGAAAVVIGSVEAQNRARRYDDRAAPPPPPPEQDWRDDDYRDGGYQDGAYPDDAYRDDAYRDDTGPDSYADSGFDPAAVRSEDQAIDACAAAAENQGRQYAPDARVIDIGDADRDTRGWVVDGTVDMRDGDRDARGGEARFRCAVTFQGLRDVRIEGYDQTAR